MKYLIFTLIISCSLIIKSNAEWIQTSGPSGGNVFTMATLSSRIFAGTEHGIFVTTNGGLNWTQTFIDTLKEVNSIVINGSIIYAGTSTGLYLSTNNGQSWTTTTLPNVYVLSLAISGTKIFAGTWLQGIYSSTNSGQTWYHVSFSTQDIFSLATDGSNTYAGAYGLYKSTNNGQSWTQTSLGIQNVYSILINNLVIYAGTFQNGVYSSTNNGLTWIQTSLNNQYVWSIANSNTYLFAGADYNGVFLSTNNGVNWVQKNEGLGNQTVRSFLVADPYLYAGTNTKVWKRLLTDFVGISSNINTIPKNYNLGQNYPNPFNPSTSIEYSIIKTTDVNITIYDITGRIIDIPINTKQPAGIHKISFDGSNLPSGVYFYKLVTEEFSDTKKMILMK